MVGAASHSLAQYNSAEYPSVLNLGPDSGAVDYQFGDSIAPGYQYQQQFAEPDVAYSIMPTATSATNAVSETGALADGDQNDGRARNLIRALGKDFNDPACAKSHKNFNYLNDYSYLDDPDYNGKCLGDSLKRLGRTSKDDKTWIDVGGRMRLRYHHENGLARLTGSEFLDGSFTDHMLLQARLFADMRLGERVRIFAEGIYADAPASTLGYRPRGNERNRGDALNLFIDLMPNENTTVRIGRQQILYGSRRIFAGPGWANTSRSHDGVKLIRKFDNLQVDAFYFQRVPVLVDDFDEPDFDRSVWGIWSAYTGPQDNLLDLYYVGIDDDVPGAQKQLHTVGARIFGEKNNWLYDFEGAGQFGRQEARGVDHAAAFSTVGLGRKFSDLPWQPTLWGYFDFATGDTPGGAFNQWDSLFNRRHHYLGFIDLVQRRNIEIPSVELTMKPNKRLSLMTRYFHITANQATDVIIPLGGGLVPQNTTSKDFGDTLDLAAKYKISSRSDTRVGYSKFWRGSKVTATENPAFFYAEWALWF